MNRTPNDTRVYRQLAELAGGSAAFAAATVLKAEGSTPQKAGARAAIDAQGRLLCGTIGGGVVDAEAQRRAVEACAPGRALVFDMTLHGGVDGVAAGAEPICGGGMTILIDPTAAKDRDAYLEAARAIEPSARSTSSTLSARPRSRGLLLTTIRAAADGAAETAVRWLAEEALSAADAAVGAETLRSCLARETAQLFVGASPATESPHVRTMVLVEPVIPNPRLLIVGGGHVGQALARQAVLVGFDVTVLDDRPEFADPALFPEGVATRCCAIAAEVAAFSMAKDTYIVIVTRGHEHDAVALEACIHAPAAYIGMIGSRKKVATMRRDFIASGRATAEEFDRVHAPIGLDIGAVSVPEIAASIVAELIAVRRTGVPDEL